MFCVYYVSLFDVNLPQVNYKVNKKFTNCYFCFVNFWFIIICMTIGDKIRALRQEKNLKQKELAEKINVSATALVFVEKNIRQPSKEMVLRLSKFFNKPTDYFLFEEATDADKPVINISPETMVEILYTIQEFLAENHLSMSKEQESQLLKSFYEKDCQDREVIRQTLSALQAVGSDMFIKGK